MNYDLHPIFVHFPIALLSLYCMFELISFGRFRTNRALILVKGILATLGGLSLLLARQFGDVARHGITDQSLRALVSKHEQFANWSIAVFGIIGVGYLLALIWLYIDNHPSWIRVKSDFRLVFGIGKLITDTAMAQVLAVLGLTLLLLTGALGGAIVYGAAKDPITSFIYHLFFK